MELKDINKMLEETISANKNDMQKFHDDPEQLFHLLWLGHKQLEDILILYKSFETK